MVYQRRFQTKQKGIARITTRKLVVFKVGQDQYAIPLERVRIILKEFTPVGSLKTGYSLVRYQEQVVTVVDLSVFFIQMPAQLEYQYLIICTLPSQEYLGIPIPQMPSILDVAPEEFSEIPPLYRQGDLPPPIEKVIHSPQGGELFYLNLDSLAEKSGF